MSGATLEQTRVLLEELDAIESQIADELDRPKRTRQGAIEQEHRIRAGLESSHTRAQTLAKILKDETHVFSQEIAEMKSTSAIDSFYKKLDTLNAYFNKYPEAEAQADPLKVAKQEMERATVEFTGEEYFGKYFDLHVLHNQFRNLSCVSDNIKSQLSYAQYLTRVAVFHDIPVNEKLQDDRYATYLENLCNYLVSFLERTQPLADHSVSQLQSEFESQLESGSLPGWESLTRALKDSNNLDLDSFTSAKELEAQGPEVLKSALLLRGLKCGGTVEQRANRLFQVKGLRPEEYPRKLRAKGGAKVQHVTDDSKTDLKLESAQMKLARLEFYIQSMTEKLVDTLESTKEFVTKKQTRTYEELKAEMAEDEQRGELSDGDLEDDEDEEDVLYNPLDIPLGFDGKPIPYWLFKLHGLDKSYDCEICGNYTYRGRRAFDRHFQERRHAQSMRILGIPNTKHFHDITLINDAKELYAKLKQKLDKESFVTAVEEQFEDSQGNVLSKRVYEDLKRQGML